MAWCKTRAISRSIQFEHAVLVAKNLFLCFLYNFFFFFKKFSKKFHFSDKVSEGNVTDSRKITECMPKAKADSQKWSQRSAKVKAQGNGIVCNSWPGSLPSMLKVIWDMLLEKSSCFPCVVLFLVLLLISHANPVSLLHVHHFYMKAADRCTYIQCIAKG